MSEIQRSEIKAWSYSLLTAFELCGKKFLEEKIVKSIQPEKLSSPASDYGLSVHKHFEEYLRNGTELPLDLQHHTSRLERLSKIGEPMAEQRLALTSSLEPTGFFDDDVWFRAIVDYATIVDGVTGLVVDFKTGKRDPSQDQVGLQAAALRAYKPHIKTWTGMYYWTKSKSVDVYKFKPEDFSNLWAEYIERSERMFAEIKAGNFRAQPNFLCNRYCPVRSCKHNGRYLSAS